MEEGGQQCEGIPLQQLRAKKRWAGVWVLSNPMYNAVLIYGVQREKDGPGLGLWCLRRGALSSWGEPLVSGGLEQQLPSLQPALHAEDLGLPGPRPSCWSCPLSWKARQSYLPSKQQSVLQKPHRITPTGPCSLIAPAPSTHPGYQDIRKDQRAVVVERQLEAAPQRWGEYGFVPHNKPLSKYSSQTVIHTRNSYSYLSDSAEPGSHRICKCELLFKKHGISVKVVGLSLIFS